MRTGLPRRMGAASLLLALASGYAPVRALPPSVAVMSAYYYRFIPGWDPSSSPSYDPSQPDDDLLSTTLTKIELHVTQGSRLLFVNADTFAPHDVVAVHPYGTPAPFATKTVLPSGDPDQAGLNAGQASFVEGVEVLAIGRYPFICGIHGDLMSGTLYVDPR